MPNDSQNFSTTEAELEGALKLLPLDQQAAPEYLAARVIANLPLAIEPFDAALAWIQQTFWRSALAAVAPIALGIVIGSTNLTQQDYWQEAEMLVFAEILEEYESDEI